MNIHFVAKTLNGDVSNRCTVLCPGPGHSAGDRPTELPARVSGERK